MKIYLVDVNNAIGMSHYETFFYQNIKQGNISVYGNKLTSLNELDSVLAWINEDINQNPFSIRQALVIIFIPRKLSDKRTPADYEILAQMYINELLEHNLDRRFRFLCFYLDDTGMDRDNDIIYREIDELNERFSADDDCLRSSFLPCSLPPGDPKEQVRMLISNLTDKVATDFYNRVLENLEKNEIAEDSGRITDDNWYVNMFLRSCNDFISNIKTFRGNFYTEDIEQKIVVSLKIVHYICDFADQYNQQKDFDEQLASFLNIKKFNSFQVNLDADKVVIATYKERLRSWTPPELYPDHTPIETFIYDESNHSREFKEKIDEVSKEDLKKALNPSNAELSEFDLQENVFASLDRLIQDVEKLLRTFCEARITEMRQFFIASVPTVLERGEGIELTDDELKAERVSASGMNHYIADELPGYPAELKLRQELELIGKKIRQIGRYMKAMKLIAFLLTLLFGIASVGVFYYALQNSVFEKEKTWTVFGEYIAVCAVLFAGSYTAVRNYYRRKIRKYLQDCYDRVMDYLKSYIGRAEEFEANLNAAMRYYCNIDKNNKNTARRRDLTVFELRKQWHQLRINSILKNLSFFDVFIKGVNPADEKGVPESKLLKDDDIHSDFYQMKIFR